MGGGLLLPTSPFSLLKTTAWSLAPSQLIFRSSEGRLREQQPPFPQSGALKAKFRLLTVTLVAKKKKGSQARLTWQLRAGLGVRCFANAVYPSVGAAAGPRIVAELVR